MKELYPKCKTCGQREMPMEIVMKEFAFLCSSSNSVGEVQRDAPQYATMLLMQYERQKEADFWLHMQNELQRLQTENFLLKEKYEPQPAPSSTLNN